MSASEAELIVALIRQTIEAYLWTVAWSIAAVGFVFMAVGHRVRMHRIGRREREAQRRMPTGTTWTTYHQEGRNPPEPRDSRPEPTEDGVFRNG